MTVNAIWDWEANEADVFIYELKFSKILIFWDGKER